MTKRTDSFERELMRLLPSDKPITKKMHRAIDALIARRKIGDKEVVGVILATTAGRTDLLDALSEMEAMVVWQMLRGKSRANSLSSD